MLLESLSKSAKTDKIAIFHGDETMSYTELFKASQAIAWHIKENFKSDKPIALCGDKESLLVACMFGAVYAGKTYVVLPSVYPKNRLDYILEDCDAECLINLSNIEFDVSLPMNTIQDIPGIVEKYNCYPELDCSGLNAEDLALIIYTSGSTGNPKGVEITYGTLMYDVDFARRTQPDYATNPENQVCLASYGFVMSLLFYSYVGDAGAQWFSIPSMLLRDPRALLSYFIKLQDQVNFMLITPTLAKMLLSLPEFNEASLNKIRRIVFGGEPLTKELAVEMHNRFKNILVLNGYGATEYGASGLICPVDENSIASSTQYMPVGDGSQGISMLIDEEGNEITDENVVGEILLIGASTAKGYHNLPDLTAQHFIKINGSTPAFATGDRGYIKDGYLYVAGRDDLLVKIGGNRVELQDVEQHLSSCSIVKDCAVSTKKLPNDSNSLVAFVILTDAASNMKQLDAFLTIKQELMSQVESYKIPQKIIFIDELPKNQHGKLDRVSLQKMID